MGVAISAGIAGGLAGVASVAHASCRGELQFVVYESACVTKSGGIDEFVSVFEIFSKRQKKLRGDVPDVYTYDKIPEPLKVQIIHIWRGTLGDEVDYQNEYLGTKGAYEFIVETLCREYGLFVLPGRKDYAGRIYLLELANFLLQEQDPNKALDAIELSFGCIDRGTMAWAYLHRSDASERADDAISELNARFREHGVGYQFDGKIIRIALTISPLRGAKKKNCKTNPILAANLFICNNATANREAKQTQFPGFSSPSARSTPCCPRNWRSWHKSPTPCSFHAATWQSKALPYRSPGWPCPAPSNCP